MAIDPKLLEILVCPETHQPLELAPSELITRLETRRKTGELQNHAGEEIAEPIEAGLLREDGLAFYLIQDQDIPNMIPDERIDLAPGEAKKTAV